MAKVILEGNWEIMPNQLIQKPRKENKNLCPKCDKRENCEDFKRLEYVEVCEDYKRRKLCNTCLNREKCKWVDSESFWDNCHDYRHKINVDGTINICPLCKGEMVITANNDNKVTYTCKICDYKEKMPELGYIITKQQKDVVENMEYKYIEDKKGDYYCWQNKGEIIDHFSHRGTLKDFKDTYVKRSDGLYWNFPFAFDKNPSHIVYYKRVIDGNNGIVTEPIAEKEISIKIEVFKDIGEELHSLGFEKGAKSFIGLKSEYDSVSKIFTEYRNIKNSLIDVPKVQETTNKIYEKGLKFLRLISEIFKQLNVTKYDYLVAENEELKVSLNDCKNKESALYKTLKTAIDKNQKNLDLMKYNKDRISELLGQVSLCKDAIMEVRLGIPELLHHQSTDELNKTILSSKDRISFGQRLLDEYKREGL